MDFAAAARGKRVTCKRGRTSCKKAVQAKERRLEARERTKMCEEDTIYQTRQTWNKIFERRISHPL